MNIRTFVSTFIAMSTPLTAATWYVDSARSGIPPQVGTSWTAAFADLQDALSSASSGDEIWIADGVYYPDDAEAGIATVVANDISSTFTVPTGVALYGGFSGNEMSRDDRDASINLTVLSGDLEQDDLGRDANQIVTNASSLVVGDTNAMTVLTVTPNSTGVILDGLVFTSGLHNSTNQPAGLRISGGETMIRDCHFQGNFGDDGGAVSIEDHLDQNFQTTFVGCDFISNSSVDTGGAVKLDNDVTPPGTGTFINCLFSGNNSASAGGAIRVSEDTSTNLIGCAFTSNSSSGNGGAFQFAWYANNPVSHTFTNCTFTGNVSASTAGALFFCNEDSVGSPDVTTVSFTNTIISNNKDSSGTSTASSSYVTEGNVITVSNNSFLENINPGGTNLDGTSSANAPIFLVPVMTVYTPPTTGDARLKGESPGIDIVGDSALPSDTYDLDGDGNTSEKLPVDLAGNVRLNSDQLDLGAYEYHGPTVTNPILGNLELDRTGATTVVIDLDYIFGSSDHTYAASVSSTTAFDAWDVDHTEGNFEMDPPFGTVGDTATVTITATDTNGNQISYTFTVEVISTAPSDTLDASLISWYTERTGRYARIYETDAAQGTGTSVATWSRGTTQSLPVYAGPREISYSADWIYLKTPNLATQVMGPWYVDAGRNNLFQDLPVNQALVVRFPRIPTLAATLTETPLGAMAYTVDGTALFNMKDSFSYDNSAGEDDAPGASPAVSGDGVWNRIAFVTEGITTDAMGAHQAGGGDRHNHSNPLGIRYLLGDSMDWVEASNTYTENFNGQHSPIIGWANDGIPIYGPYGYNDPFDESSPVRRMTSGYQLRDGSNGSVNLNSLGRVALPVWTNRLLGRTVTLLAGEHGPSTTTAVNGETYSLGRYIEDYAYMGDLGLIQGADFDLNEYNARFCITPEFPDGTWAYFSCLDASGTPAFPYLIGPTYLGDPTGSEVSSIDETVTVDFEGGENKSEENRGGSEESNEAVLTWSVVEGGVYVIESSTTLDGFSNEMTNVPATTDTLSFVDPDYSSENAKFYRIGRTGLAAHDTTPFETINLFLDGVTPNNGNGGPPGSAPTVTVSFAVNGGTYLGGTITSVSIDTPMPISAPLITTNATTYSGDFTLAGPPGAYTMTANFSDGATITSDGAVFTINGGGPPAP